MTSTDIEVALIRYYDPQKNFIIPNVSWGWGIHECDLLVVNKNRFCYEIEIKVSMSDLKKDLIKPHQHKDKQNRLKYLWFAMPEEMIKSGADTFIPAGAGIFMAKLIPAKTMSGYRVEVEVYRNASQIKDCRPITDKEYGELGRLAMLRMCNMKLSIHNK